ncbi:hypothetical protein FBU59_001300 [Linderina macrospora]|uniref:Uncharacterized protein n=1 Tax=Linderina macrospora TaxID=4868 RepID=A0ACC1JE88_9FUNG|nr:hypothetical protein FBU59_001300 [Linderina macrospora]
MLHGFLVGLTGAKRILEIAQRRQGGVDEITGHKPVVFLELGENFAQAARQNFVDAGLEDYIEVIVGDANESLATLENMTFDIAFVDADKTSYRYYYDAILEKDMLSKSSLIIADNTTFTSVTTYLGAPTPVTEDAKPIDIRHRAWMHSPEISVALHEFNEYVRHDSCTEAVMLPLFTGIPLIRRIA